MNPLHRTTAGARTSEDLVPEAHGYGYIASSEAAPAAPSQTVPDAYGYGYVVVSDDDDSASAPAAEVAEPVSAAPATVQSPLIEFVTDTPAVASAESAEPAESAELAESAPVRSVAAEPISVAPAVVLSPLLPNIGTSTMARLLDLTEVPLSEQVPASTARVVVIDASEKGIAAVTAHIEELAARGSRAPGSITEVSGLNGIMVIPTGRGRLPRSVRLRLKVLSGAHPVLVCPWIPALASRICDDAALQKAAATRPVAAALKKLAAQVEDLAG